MPLFKKLFKIFENEKPHKRFEKLYDELSDTAALLAKETNLLRELQKELVASHSAKVIKHRPGESTHMLGLKKTESIEQVLVPQLNELADKTADRFIVAAERTKQEQPFSLIEENEMKSILDYLKAIKSLIPIKIDKSLSVENKLIMVESKLREVDRLSKNFFEAQKKAEAIAKEVRMHEISPLLRSIFKDAKEEVPRPGEYPMRVYEVSKGQLGELFEEAKRINESQDPRWQVKWRQWWVDQPKMEKDNIHPQEHINVVIIFNGEKKKIHLLLKAA